MTQRQSGFDFSTDPEAETSAETRSRLLEDQTLADEDELSHEADEEDSEPSPDPPGGLTGRLRRWFS